MLEVACEFVSIYVHTHTVRGETSSNADHGVLVSWTCPSAWGLLRYMLACHPALRPSLAAAGALRAARLAAARGKSANWGAWLQELLMRLGELYATAGATARE